MRLRFCEACPVTAGATAMTKTTEVHLALSQRLNAAVSEAIQARSPFPLTYVANCLLAENVDAEQAAAAYVEKHDLGARMRAALAAAETPLTAESAARALLGAAGDESGGALGALGATLEAERAASTALRDRVAELEARVKELEAAGDQREPATNSGSPNQFYWKLGLL